MSNLRVLLYLYVEKMLSWTGVRVFWVTYKQQAMTHQCQTIGDNTF